MFRKVQTLLGRAPKGKIRSKFGTRWIGANPEKSDLVNLRGPD